TKKPNFSVNKLSNWAFYYCKFLNGKNAHFVYGRAPWGMLMVLISYTPNELDYPEESEAKRFTP
ncbi:hypothetical protein V7Z92_29090, partial [Priestia megaterium]